MTIRLSARDRERKPMEKHLLLLLLLMLFLFPLLFLLLLPSQLPIIESMLYYHLATTCSIIICIAIELSTITFIAIWTSEPTSLLWTTVHCRSGRLLLFHLAVLVPDLFLCLSTCLPILLLLMGTDYCCTALIADSTVSLTPGARAHSSTFTTSLSLSMMPMIKNCCVVFKK